MEYFIYCRDRADTAALRDELVERHWAFMDDYADAMIARGPTLTPDGESATGSLHIVDLPDDAAVRVFAYEEPNYRAGVYEAVLVRRWRNDLGTTMWDYDGDPQRNGRFLFIGHGTPTTVPGDVQDAERRFRATERARLIASGPLLTDDGTRWQGCARLVEAADRAAAEILTAADPYTHADMYTKVELHDWQFGGRR